MRTRTSIELHTGGCRLVEVVTPPASRRSVAPADVRVTAFATSLPDGEDAAFVDTLRSLRAERKLSKRAVVTLWGLRSTQQLLRLPPAKSADLELLAAREARKDIAPFETEGDRASVSVAAGNEVQVGTHRRREVSLVAASSADVRRRIQPIIDAGFVVDAVLTPALALAEVSRTHRDLQARTTAAYVAVTASATCLAIVRDGFLLFAREMPWGHATAPATPGESVAVRLASELRRSMLFFKQTFRAPVEAVVLCGDLPNLRTLTAPLGEALAVPVHTLDSLAGLDSTAVPEPAERFRAQAAALRVAIAAGAGGGATNLMPTAILKTRQARVEMFRLAAAVAASLLIVMAWYAIVRRTGAEQRREQDALQQQVALLEPEATRLTDLRRQYAMQVSRNAAVQAFATQGPRLARFLEALSQATPDDIVLSAIKVQASGPSWHADVVGVAVADDAASGQSAVNRMMSALSASPFAGAPVQAPALRVVSGTGAKASTASGDRAVTIPDGKSGVEFTADFEVAK